MPDRWLKSGYIRKVLRPARSVKVSRGRTRTSGRCPWHPMPLLPCSPPPYCSQPHFDTKIQSTLRIYATFFFKTSPCLQPTFTRRTSGNSVVTFRTVFFCFPVITATCVCNHSPPPQKKRNFCLLIVLQCIEKPQKRKTDTLEWPVIQNMGMKKAIDGLWA